MSKRIGVIFTLVAMHIVAFTQTMPFSTDKLVIWYSSDSVHLTMDSCVDTLYDISGNGRHAIQLVAGKQPKWIESDEHINGLPTLRFDGNNFLSSVSDELFEQPNTFFIVWKTDDNKTSTSLTGANTSQRNQLGVASSNIYLYGGKMLSVPKSKVPFNYSIVQSLFDGKGSFVSCNGEKMVIGDAGNMAQKGLSIGADMGGGNGTVGNISEIIFFNKAISPKDSSLVMEYLFDKYTWKDKCVDKKIIIDYGFAPVEYSPYGWAQSFIWDDGETSPQKSIVDGNPHTLTITDVFGFTHSYSITVEYPEITQLRDTIICTGDTITWNTNLDGQYTYLWSNGSTESSLRIFEEGRYWVEITDTLGFKWHSDTTTIAVDSIMFKSAMEDNISICSGENVSASIDDCKMYRWNTGSNQKSITVIQPGKYWVDVTDNYGCSMSDTVTVNINGVAPDAFFVFTYAETNKPLTFQNQSRSNDGSGLNYFWNFGDGEDSRKQNPSHIYKLVDSYVVTLEVFSESGCYASFSDTIDVRLNSSIQVKPLFPNESQTLYSNQVTFRWEKIEGCKYYNIQVANDSIFNNIVFDTIVQSANSTITLDSGRFFWRIKTEVGIFNNARSFMVSPINAIIGLASWYSSDSVHLTMDSCVDTLYDISGNGRHAIQLVAGKQPKWIESDEHINGLPTLRFDGNNFLSSVSDELFEQPNTFFIVWKTDDNKTSTSLTGANTSQRNQLGVASSNIYLYGGKMLSVPKSKVPFNYSIVQSLFDGKGSFVSCNGEKMVIGDAGNMAQKGLSIGADMGGGNGTVGNISEIIFFNKAISPKDSSLVMEYLFDKYTWKDKCVDKKIIIDYGFAPVEYSPYGWAQSFIWDDGETSPQKSIVDGNPHTLTITDVFGFTHSYSITVEYPEITQLRDTIICTGDTITWNTNLDGQYTYLWSNGSTESSLRIFEEGRYWVEITDTLGFKWHSDTVMVEVDSFPVTARLEGDQIISCIGNNIYLQTGFEEAVSYLWSNGSTADHLEVTEAGQYWVKMADNLGCKAADTAYISILGIAPTPDFTNSALCATREISFRDNSRASGSSLITSHLWQFGDGGTSTAINPVHSYARSGSYNLVLTIASDNGCSNQKRQKIVIDSLPKADFIPVRACSHTNVQFTDMSSTPVNYIADWQWTMSDTVFAERHPSTVFASQGDMPVQLIVTTAHGCTDTLRRTINIMQGPDVGFTFSAPCVNTPIYFTNSTSSILGLSTSYTWTADEAVFSQQRSPMIEYADTGTHIVSLSVKQLANGCSATVSKTVSVKANPRPDVDADSFCAGKAASLRGVNRELHSPSGEWLWSLDTLPEIQGQTISPVFAKSGRHKARLTIIDGNGCTAFYDTVINVRATPTAAFSARSARGPVPFEAEFVNTSRNASNYLWDFGDGRTSTETDACHTYNIDGEYTVSLEASNGNCADTAVRIVSAIVPQMNLRLLSATAETVNGVISIEAVIANLSNFDITDIVIAWRDNLGHLVSEASADTIRQNKVLRYRFKAAIGELNPERIQYICVEVQPGAAFADDDPDDNEYCIILNNSEFTACLPKPNPADKELNISYIMPEDGNVRVELFNSRGIVAAVLYDGPASAGFNSLNVDVQRFKPGMYVYKITYGETTKTQPVLISR